MISERTEGRKDLVAAGRASDLPRLLYVGDVHVEATIAGMALLYRLLQTYPVSKLRLVEGTLVPPHPDKRLQGVVYQPLHVGRGLPPPNRLGALYRCYLYLTATTRRHQLRSIVKDFQPEAVLTVAHAISWITAAATASHYALPLHLIVHDECIQMTGLPKLMYPSVNSRFGDIYRQSQSRLCVSPYMVEAYQRRYRAAGTVLYPSRALGGTEYAEPPRPKAHSSIVFAYAGSIHGLGYFNALVALASTLERLGGRLHIYTSISPDKMAELGWMPRNVRVNPIIPSNQLISVLRNEADVLFAPMDFAPEARTLMETNFQSKLADYTATGLPLLIWGPSYASAVQWAKANPGVAEVVEERSIDSLAEATVKLASDPEYRFRLGARAIDVGRQFFSHSSVVERFHQTLAGHG